MAGAVFLDNTVLCNFGAISRLDILRDWLGGRGRWTEAVAEEARRSAGHLAGMASLHDDGWLGEPLVIEGDEPVDQVERMRRHVFGGPSTQPLKHLGEAQTLWVMKHDATYREARWVSDDLDALEFARYQGFLAYDTCDVMRMVVADGDLTATLAFSVLTAMCDAGRDGVRLPDRAADLDR